MAKPSTASRLDAARVEHAATLHQIEEAEAARNSALLADDDALARKVAVRIDGLRQLARDRADKVALLEEQAEKESIAQRAKEKAGLISRIEDRLARRNEAVADLQRLLGEARVALRNVAELSNQIDAAWPWQGHDRQALILPVEYIITATRHEIFRTSEPSGSLRTAPNLPGGKSPALTLINQPEKVPELTAVFREAAELASSIMKTGKSTSGKIHEGIPDVFLKEKPPLSSQEQKLSELLRRQAQLANDMSPSGEKAYSACVGEIAVLQGEIEAAKQGAAAT
jgi:hypothetical protein